MPNPSKNCLWENSVFLCAIGFLCKTAKNSPDFWNTLYIEKASGRLNHRLHEWGVDEGLRPSFAPREIPSCSATPSPPRLSNDSFILWPNSVRSLSDPSSASVKLCVYYTARRIAFFLTYFSFLSVFRISDYNRVVQMFVYLL